MEEIGVQLIVEGLDAFLSDIGKAKGSLLDAIAPPSLLQDAFGSLWTTLGNFSSWVGDVLTNTIGFILRDAIEGTTKAIGEMVSMSINAGAKFQALQVRLDGINLHSAENSSLSYADALKVSTQQTQDQMKWIQQMAIITPFQANGIASVYTMQRAMGLSDDEAKKLTTSITNMAAGAGLSDDAVLGMSTALAKATSAGKVNGLTLRALQSYLVPIPDIMKQMALDTGKTTEELAKMQKKGELAPLGFITAFEEVVNKRFPDSANALAHTWQGSVDNLKDIVSNIGGNEIVKPILDSLGGVTGSFVDLFATIKDGVPSFTELGQKLYDSAGLIGKSIAEIIDSVIGLSPSVDDMASTLVGGVQGFATWLSENKDGIIESIKNIVDWVMNLGKSDFLGGIIKNLGAFWDQLFKINAATGENGMQTFATAVSNVGKAIMGVLDPFLKPLGINISGMKPSLSGFVDGLNGVSKWINDNQALLRTLLGIFIAFEVMQTITNLVFSFIVAIGSLIVAVAGILIGFGLFVVMLHAVIVIVAIVMASLLVLQLAFSAIQFVVALAISFVLLQFRTLETAVHGIVAAIATAFSTGDWVTAIRNIGGIVVEAIQGNMSNIFEGFRLAGDQTVQGFNDGFFARWKGFLGDVGTAIDGLVQTVMGGLGIHSPSTVFAGIGTNIVKGMADGITDATNLAVGAMSQMVASVTMPAMNAPTLMQNYTQAAPSSISTTYQSNQTNNLNIHTNAKSEPIVQDFQMMQSLASI